MVQKTNIDKLLNLVEIATSPFHTVLAAKKQLEEAGFEPLYLNKEWALEAGGKYYTIHHDSSLFAFKIGEDFEDHESFRISAAHTDFPAVRLKPNPEMKSEGYAQVNVEIYGGAILNTWLDRPLSAAGRVVLKSDQVFKPNIRFVDLKKPLFIIPNLAIHLNREINKGVELNRQKDMLPILGMIKDMVNEDDYFVNYLAQHLKVVKEDILDYELSLYNTDVGDVIGLHEDFISAPRLDDLTAVQSVLTGLIEGTGSKGIHVAALFDHEEIGSKTKQGGGSVMMSLLLEKIVKSLGHNRLSLLTALPDSLFLSVDVAHAIHPNQAAKSDPVNKVILNGGFCIKEACSQAYATDSEAIGIVMQICEEHNIPYQKMTNRSDGTGGGTLGSIASTMLPVRTVDIGIPLLAMHSSRELGGCQDQENMTEFMKAFYSVEE